jgi:hypothetical protein
MTTLDDLPFLDGRESPPTPSGARDLRCRRHRWVVTDGGGELPTQIEQCANCDRLRERESSRRGRSSARLGKDQERRIERIYGPRKVGEYGDAVDHLGRDFKWQAKASRQDPPLWLAAIAAPTWRPIVPKSIREPMAHMAGIGGMRRALVIRSYVHHGLPVRDWLFIVGLDWFRLHGTASIPGFGGFVIPGGAYGYVVIPGAAFLEMHGRDEETAE